MSEKRGGKRKDAHVNNLSKSHNNNGKNIELKNETENKTNDQGSFIERNINYIKTNDNLQNFFTRVAYGSLMGITFLGLIGMGVIPLTILILIVLCMMFNEVMQITEKASPRRAKNTFVSKYFPTYFMIITLVVVLTSTLEAPFQNTYPELFALVPPYKSYNFWNLTSMAFRRPNYKHNENILTEVSVAKWVENTPFNGTVIQKFVKDYRLTITDRMCALFAIIYMCRPLLIYSFYILGFVLFVLSLDSEMYKYQFRRFAWMVMGLVFIIIQGFFQINIMLQGIIWFLVPIMCVIQNDIWAYLCGKAFGRTKLLRLSPKKTLEGFLGAFLFTMAWGWWSSGFLAKFPAMTCPKMDFVSPPICAPNPLFIFSDVAYPPALRSFVGGVFSILIFLFRSVTQAVLHGRAFPSFLSFFSHVITASSPLSKDSISKCLLEGCNLNGQYVSPVIPSSFSMCPMQIHGLIISIFCSLIAPFGGFFASGVKRANKLKDFGTLIPGHGGVTDRMDCQCTTGLFVYLYIQAFILPWYYSEGAGESMVTIKSIGSLAAVRAMARAHLLNTFKDSGMETICVNTVAGIVECAKHVATTVGQKKELLDAIQKLLNDQLHN